MHLFLSVAAFKFVSPDLDNQGYCPNGVVSVAGQVHS